MNKAQAQKLARQVFDEFDKQILEATRGTKIPPRFIAGLVANEAGKDRQGNIRRAATRFEPHIYTKLKRVATTPRATFGQITHNDLKDATDTSLRALAHSYEATQMMGYWCIVLGCTLADLKNPDKHFFYTVKLLQLNDQGDFSRGTEDAFDDEMRQWNTGREKGKTYHENYVPNARLIRAAYRELEKDRTHRSIEERINIDSAAAPTVDLPVKLSEQLSASSANQAVADLANEPISEVVPTDSGAAPNATSEDKDKSPQVIDKERPSLFTKVWTAVIGAIATAVASITATCGGNEIATTIVTKSGERVVENVDRSDIVTFGFVVLYTGLGLGAAVLLFWLASRFYDKSAERSNKLNVAKVATAADTNLNTVEFKR